jgi:hypothetical protein
MNSFNSSLTQKPVPSPLGSRQPSPEDQPVTLLSEKPQYSDSSHGLSRGDTNPQISSLSAFGTQEVPHNSYESDVMVKREQAVAASGRF